MPKKRKALIYLVVLIDYYKASDKYIPFDRITYRKVKNRGIEYINLPCAFDIETSSFEVGEEKHAIMYIWQLCIGDGDLVIIGRTWKEFLDICDRMKKYFKLYRNKHHGRILPIYIHNMAYEMSFMRRWFRWYEMFSTDLRRPIRATTEGGIEFRDSYILSGMSLEKVGQNLIWHNIKKLVGNLDYSKIRHSKTPIHKKELSYCINDVLVLSAYIAEKIKQDGNVVNIPMTKTGYVRRSVRSKCYGTKAKSQQRKNYRTFIKALTIEPEEHNILKDAFAGGFTHACMWNARQEIRYVGSYDFTSSYPAVMCAYMFPMSKGIRIFGMDMKQVLRTMNMYHYIFEITFTNLRSKITYEHYLSISKCIVSGKYDYDNGRIIKAEHCTVTITEVDLQVIMSCYKWDDAKIGICYQYKKGYLPKPIIESIFDFYEAKTTLKNVKGKEVEYLVGKENLNSIYGMSVTSIIQELITYDEDTALWSLPKFKDITEADNYYNEMLVKYNNSRNRFLYYPWGIYVTAYARYNLWTGIHEFGRSGDYIYSDTDSIKATNVQDHEEYIHKYNEYITYLISLMCKHHKIDIARSCPKTIEGKEKPLGVWDFEGTYDRFKTLGAKRYIVEHDGEIEITVAGLGKKKAVEYLTNEMTNDEIFQYFDVSETNAKGFEIPEGNAGRLVMTYFDDEIKGRVKDYRGIECDYYEKSGVHSREGSYTMSMGKVYLEHLLGIADRRLGYI